MYSFVIILSCRSDKGLEKVDTSKKDIEEYPVEFLEDTVCSDTIEYDVVRDNFHRRNVTVEHHDGGGAAIIDFDGDGNLDILFGFTNEPLYWYRIKDEQWIGEELPIVAGGLSLIEIQGQRRLIVADRDLSFLWYENDQPQTKILLERTEVAFFREGLPIDMDGDGDLDIYVSRTVREQVIPNPSLLNEREDLLLINSDGEFEEMIRMGGRTYRQAYDTDIFDWNVDGRFELYVANDMGHQYGGNFILDLSNWPYISGHEHFVMDSMGLDFSDMNGDGKDDLYIGDLMHNRLFIDYDNVFVDYTSSMHANPLLQREMSWGTLWVDYDNDGDEDILFTRGDLYLEGEEFPQMQEMRFGFLQNEGNIFQIHDDFLEETLLEGSWRSVVSDDLNQDGVLDFLITDVEEKPLLLVSRHCSINNWLKVIVPYGTRVDIYRNDRLYRKWARTGSSYHATKESYVWFGLGRNTRVSRMEVLFPNGEIQVFENIASRQSIHLIEP